MFPDLSKLRTLLSLRIGLSLIVLAGLLASQIPLATGQEAEVRSMAPVRLLNPIDEHALVTLKGNVRRSLTPDRDLGRVDDSMPLHLFMVLQRTPAQEADLQNLIARQQQPTAAEYHKWLTPKQFGARFGVHPDDIAKVSSWLESHGLEVRSVLNNGTMIEFGATAGQIQEAFHTEMHYWNMPNGKFVANARDPQIPAALAPVVAGVMGMDKIPPHMNKTPNRQTAYDKDTHTWHPVNPSATDLSKPDYYQGGSYLLVAPQDLYTIYNINPVFTSGELGAKAAVAVVEESDIEYGTVNGTTGAATGGDVTTFRNLFGVPGTLNMHVYHGYGTVTCSDPGIDPSNNGEDGEASLDAEWANATAPSANLIFMSCDNTTDNGIFSSLAALIDNNISDVMSLSYGNSELNFSSSSSFWAFQDGLYSQAATQGQSIFISAGDSGSDVQDQNTSGTATNGINVSAFGTPLVTVAGGTDFSDQYDDTEGGIPLTNYWSTTNSQYYGDALGYIPETSWNGSCASSLRAIFWGKIDYGQAYTPAQYCAVEGAANDATVVGGSGGISTHYAAPAWQTGISGYSNAFHSQPDISGFASNGVWDHYLLDCDSHDASSACTSPTTFGGAGGTSFVAPYLAGVAGLLVDYTGARQGLLNPTLYALAKAQYTNSPTSCYSNGQTSNTGTTTSLPASTCIFNDVTTSNNDVPCAAGSTNCYVLSGDSYGLLSTTGSSSLTAAYASTPGFDQVTGLGTLNVNNLITKWKTAFTSTTALTATATSITPSQSTTLTGTVSGGTPANYVDTPPAVTGTVSFKAGTTSLGSCTLSSGKCTYTVAGSSLSSGANSITATYSGSGTYPSSTSSILTVTVTAGSTVTLSATSLSFPSTNVGASSASQSVTMTNTGTSSLSITSIAVTGTNASSFVFTNNCGTTLAAGANCTIQGDFAPTTTGALTAAVTITDNATGSPQSIALSGTGVSASAPAVTLSATSISFPATKVGGSSASQSVTMTNTGSATLTISSIAITGANASSFAFANSCGTSLAAGANCSIHGHFGPTTTGALTAAITITDNATGSPQSIALSGTGAGAAAVSLSATSLPFGNQAVGTASASQSVTLTNTGTGTLSITSIAVTGTNASAWAFGNTCGTSLAAGANCSIHGHFAPTAAGAMTAAITITDNATGSPQSIALTGTGFTSTTVSLSATSLSFGSVLVGSTSPSQSVTLTNTGSVPLVISSIAVTGTNASSWVFANSCGTSLAAGANCSIHGHFAPTTAGALTAAITITDTTTNSPQSIALKGTGIGPTTVTLSPTTLAFGNQKVGTASASLSATLTNTGTSVLSITSITLGGTNASAFAFGNSCGSSLAVGANCTIHGHFAPTTTGAMTAKITLIDSATGSPQTISLTGTGN